MKSFDGSKYLDRLFDALYPRGVVCFACNREWEVETDGLCPACRKELRCAPTLPQIEGITRHNAGVVYDEWIYGAVYRFKYKGAAYLAEPLAGLMPRANTTPELLLPVPLWPGKQQKRGYNQSLLLAYAYQKRYYPDVPIGQNSLIRVRDTGSQTRLDRNDRWGNMKNAFAADPSVSGKSVLLIDDITTTGSTLRACANALKQAGAAAVEAVCICAAL